MLQGIFSAREKNAAICGTAGNRMHRKASCLYCSTCIDKLRKKMGAEMCEPTPEQNATGNTITDSIDTEPVPKKRGKRAIVASIIICVIAVILVLTFCIINGEEYVYKIDETQKNTTNVCYKKEKKLTLSGLFTTALGLFSVVVGTLVDRLLLLAEERHHRHERYDGSWTKIIKASFSGIVWGPVVVLLLLTFIIYVILILTTDRPVFELSYLVYIFSGIGVGPLIMRLLNLNTESEVYISTILEEKGTYVANGLAWSYYFNYLEQALLTFKDIVKSPLPSPHNNIQLSSDKLLLLVPLDCHIVDDLNRIDNQIERLVYPENSQNSFNFSVYRLRDDGEDKYFAIQYVEAPLKALRRMSLFEEIEAVKRKNCHKEVKLLYTKLFEILADPVEQNIKGTCIVVPIKAEDSESLQNGGLVRCIMKVVNRSRTQIDGIPGFISPKISSKKSDEYKAIDIPAESSHFCDTQDDKCNDKKGKMVKYTNKQPTETEQDELIPQSKKVDTPDPKKLSVQEVERDINSVASTSEINTEMASTPALDQQEIGQQGEPLFDQWLHETEF